MLIFSSSATTAGRELVVEITLPSVRLADEAMQRASRACALLPSVPLCSRLWRRACLELTRTDSRLHDPLDVFGRLAAGDWESLADEPETPWLEVKSRFYGHVPPRATPVKRPALRFAQCLYDVTTRFGTPCRRGIHVKHGLTQLSRPS